MEDITQRLKDACEACTKTYTAWRAKSSDHTAREALMEAVHELRKVAARLEIDLAVADRQQNPNDPIPIPSHRAARRGGPGAQGPADDIGNSVGGDDGRPQQRAPRPAPRREEGDNASASASSGGSGKPLSLKRSSEND
ncbi:MAG TPA: hypothetical protein VIN59_08090 [Alphaproteobacteria bacterium]